MRLFRHILIAAALPVAALLVAAIFAPAGPPTASAASDGLSGPAQVETCHAAPPSWLESIFGAYARSWFTTG